MQARWLWLAVLAGCPDRAISELPVDQDKVEVVTIPVNPRRDIDLLFVIDDSGSMEDEQASLRANFGRMVEVLESIDGGLPDVQIGVITPNVGTSSIDGTDIGSLAECSGQGEDGRLRELSPGGPRFLRSVRNAAGGRDTNFTGALTDAFAQLATVGIAGCGIEQHLEAAKRATDGSNPENAGFIRDGAYLGVIVIADEDDCSLADSALFRAHLNDPLYGEKTNFRCTTEGVRCDSPSTPFDAALGPREDCYPREDPTEVAGVARYVEHFRTLKPSVRDVVLAGIVGDPGAFEITERSGVHVLGNSCPQSSGQKALPAVRIGHFLSQFPDRNTRTTICDGDLSDGLVQIAALLKDVLVDPCFDSTPLDMDPATPGPQYECSVIEVLLRPGEPAQEVRALPACELGGLPCWRIEEDAVSCSYTESEPHLKLVIERDDTPRDPDLHIRASCVTAAPTPPAT